MPNTEIIQASPVERPFKPQSLQEYYDAHMKDISERQNWPVEVRHTKRSPDGTETCTDLLEQTVLDDDCRINPKAFEFYNPNDDYFVMAHEGMWQLKPEDINENVRAYYKDQNGGVAMDDAAIIKRHREEHGARNGSVAEKMVEQLLYRFIGKDYLVCGASKYDDIKHGIDTVIVDKENGEIVAGFDDVNYLNRPEPIDRVVDRQRRDPLKEKQKRMLKSITSPKRLKYGFKMDKDTKELIGTTVDNLPVFYLGIDEDNFKKLRGSRVVPGAPITEDERDVFLAIVRSLKEQRESVLARLSKIDEEEPESVEKAVRKRLNSFSIFVDRLNDIALKTYTI